MKKIMIAVMLIQIINGSIMAQTQVGLQINPFYNKAPLTLNMGLIPLSGGVPTATFVAGSRLDGFDNHPTQITGLASGLIDGIDGVGVGLKINNESAGLSSNTDAELGFGYFVYTNKEKGDKLSFALSGHFIQNKLSREGILVLDPNDPNLANISQVQPTGNASASIAFIRENKYYAGLSAYQLIKNKNAFMTSGWNNYTQRTYYFVGAYTFELNEKLALEASGAAVYANPKAYAFDA
ncbi:MAG: type IX secretion system membrane protein PorP/SprF [Geobacteraceae bacterium]|nr:type IX secretion system membrane protein PorP/SprF [Geobacteraceae bacterium]